MSSLFNAPHPLVPLATFNVADGESTALKVVHSPISPPPLPPMSLLDADISEFQLEGAACGTLPDVNAAPAMPTYSLFPSEDPRCDEPSRFSIFSAGPADPAMTPGSESECREAAPDFLGRLQHMKSLFRMSTSEEPVSMMIHRVGPLLILDDGPRGWSRCGAEHSQIPLPPGLDPPGLANDGGLDSEPQLMLAALDASLKTSLLGPSAAEASQSRMFETGQTGIDLSLPGIGQQLEDAPSSELMPRLCVKNTFIDIAAEEENEACDRTQSAPGRIGLASPATPPGTSGTNFEGNIIGNNWNLPLAPVMQRLQQHVATTEGVERASDAGSWSILPYQPEIAGSNAAVASTKGGHSVFNSRQWDLLQLASQQKLPLSCRTLEAMRALFADIPPQPSRLGRAMEWRCGPYKILLGCDMVVFRTDDQLDVSQLASFKTLPPGASPEPSREERLDVYLENLMCNINTAVWGSHHQGQMTWRVFDTQDLPAAHDSAQEESQFDAESVLDQGQRLLHFLRQQCHREGGTYWLFREQNSPHAELFDLKHIMEPSLDADNDGQCTSRAFGATESLVLPIASLCVHIAKATPNPCDQRALLQKAISLLEPAKQEHPGLYATVALKLACSYMRTAPQAIPDSSSRGSSAAGSVAEPPAAARLAMALRYLEAMLRLLLSLDDIAQDEMADVALHAELLLQAHVAYAECIVKLVKETFVPTYTAWLTEVQKSTQDMSKTQGSTASSMIAEMKRLSAGFLLWRLFWLVRAQRALDFVSKEKRETECWILERDLHETMGDALYGLSRYPADDADDLLAGLMGTSEGICQIVAEGLRSWGLRGGCNCLNSTSSSPRVQRKTSKKKSGSKRLTSPVRVAGEAAESSENQPHNVTAMFLSELNPLSRGFCDDAVCDDYLVNEKIRPTLWTEGVAFKTSLALFEKAAVRLRKAFTVDSDSSKGRRSSEDQTTLKIARKLAHLYNEEARSALVSAKGRDTEGVEELLTQAHDWMRLSGDMSNASRVLLNLSELHARRAEAVASVTGEDGQPLPFTTSQYKNWLKAIECCEEATSLSDNTLGRAEAAYAHLRAGVHLSTRVPCQAQLIDAGRREETLAELADKHFSKALRGFDELKDEREVAVCHYHMADLALQELRVPNAPQLSKARLVSALRHARRSAEYWERMGAIKHAKDFISAHVRMARLLENQQRSSAAIDALEHLAAVEERLLSMAREAEAGDLMGVADISELFVQSGDKNLAVVALRREMSRVCQAGIRQGDDIERLKKIYRSVLRNEALVLGSATVAAGPAGA